MTWFLHEKYLQELINAKSLDNISCEERQAHTVSVSKRKITSIKKNDAWISVNGVLTDSPDLIAELFGGGNTTYEQVSAALVQANNNPQIDNIYLDIDSPGGEATSSWLELMNQIYASKKPVTAVVETMAASAAYGIASQADKILARNKISSVGSIGVVAGYYTDDKVVEITSSDAPNKRPDVRSEDGIQTVKAQLDAMHNVFAEAVARGRKVSLSDVNTEFGKGSMILAEEAINRNMIDGFFNVAKKETPEMDLATLKAEHREIFDAVVLQERDRVMAHLKLGQESNDMITALDAIENGHELTQKITAQYLASAMRKREIETRVTDNAAVEIEIDVEDKNDVELMSNDIMIEAAESLGLNLEGVKL